MATRATTEHPGRINMVPWISEEKEGDLQPSLLYYLAAVGRLDPLWEWKGEETGRG